MRATCRFDGVARVNGPSGPRGGSIVGDRGIGSSGGGWEK